MLWVDHETYFGPDRRRKHGLRIHDRRNANLAGPPPPLRTALRRFRMSILESGRELSAFIQHADGLVLLARLQDEPEAAEILASVSGIARRGSQSGRDVRASLYNALDRAETAIKDTHAPEA